MTIKAIETKYAGCRFRSRLEARWAVFFNHMQIPWEYEPEGFDIDGRWYLPDFRLPECGTWIEVKGSEEGLDVELLRSAAKQLPTSHAGGEAWSGIILLGLIPPALVGDDDRDYGWRSLTAEGDWITASFGSYRKNNRPFSPDNIHEAIGNGLLHPSICEDWGDSRVAYQAARTARFEHGETPR